MIFIRMNKIIKIKYKNKIYEIKKENVDFIISKLEASGKKNYSEDEILSLMEKYKLYDKVFLDNINKL